MMVENMTICITGMLRTTNPKASSEALRRLPLAVSNFLRSKSSRTKAFTVRMPIRFSCTAVFMLSIRPWRMPKRLRTWLMMK